MSPWPDAPEWMMDAVTDGRMVVWTQQVLYGYRVRLGNLEGFPVVDYCCGRDPLFRALVHLRVQQLWLEYHDPEIFPMWRLRPIFREPSVVSELVGEDVTLLCEALCEMEGHEFPEPFPDREPWRRT